MDGVHDLGGLGHFGRVPVEAEGNGYEGWEGRLQALAFLCGGISRAELEQLAPADYLGSTYHERWLTVAENRMIRRGHTTRAALDDWAERVGDGVATPRTTDPDLRAQAERAASTAPSLEPVTAAAFAPGDRVRVRRHTPDHHHRSPRYVRGAVGTVDRILGADPVPGIRRSEAPVETIYTVVFRATDLWDDRGDHEVVLDLWERYLEAE